MSARGQWVNRAFCVPCAAAGAKHPVLLTMSSAKAAAVNAIRGPRVQEGYTRALTCYTRYVRETQLNTVTIRRVRCRDFPRLSRRKDETGRTWLQMQMHMNRRANSFGAMRCLRYRVGAFRCMVNTLPIHGSRSSERCGSDTLYTSLSKPLLSTAQCLPIAAR